MVLDTWDIFDPACVVALLLVLLAAATDPTYEDFGLDLLSSSAAAANISFVYWTDFLASNIAMCFAPILPPTVIFRPWTSWS